MATLTQHAREVIRTRARQAHEDHAISGQDLSHILRNEDYAIDLPEMIPYLDDLSKACQELAELAREY